MSLDIGSLLTKMIDFVKSDLQKTALPIVAQFFSSIAANPNQVNIMVQVAKLQADLVAALPGIEQDLLKQISQLLEAEAQAILAPTLQPTPVQAQLPAA